MVGGVKSTWRPLPQNGTCGRVDNPYEVTDHSLPMFIGMPPSRPPGVSNSPKDRR